MSNATVCRTAIVLCPGINPFSHGSAAQRFDVAGNFEELELKFGNLLLAMILMAFLFLAPSTRPQLVFWRCCFH